MIRNKYYLIITIGVFLLLGSGNANAQGCSDAGLCTISGMKDAHEEVDYANRLAIGLSFGQGDQSVSVFTPYLTYERKLADKLSVAGKLTYVSTDGELGSNADLGDFYANFIYTAYEADNRSFSLSAGVKLPLNSADAGDEELSLPMVYQSSLGTTDLLLGASYAIDRWGVNVGFQQPLTTEIDNSFLADEYPDIEALGYLSSNGFTRKADLLARISYSLPLSDGRLVLRPSVLPIFHLANDTYIDGDGNEVEIDGSSGLTLNGNLFAVYHLNERQAFELSLGSPFVTRDARPDGLTREFVAALEYSLRF